MTFLLLLCLPHPTARAVAMSIDAINMISISQSHILSCRGGSRQDNCLESNNSINVQYISHTPRTTLYAPEASRRFGNHGAST